MNKSDTLRLPQFWITETLENDKAGQRSKRSHLLLTLMVFFFIAAIAYADSQVDEISLGYLYILPIALSGLINRRITSFFIIFLCVLLHDIFSPSYPLIPRLFLNLFAFLGFAVVAVIANWLGKERRAFNEMVRRQRDELAKEISLAAQVQKQLLPSKLPFINGIEIATGIKYAKEMGGDYYDFIEMPDGSVGIAIADVSGKGMAAALLMPPIEVALRLNAQSRNGLENTFQSLNQVINDITDSSRFVTLFYGKLLLPEKHFEYVNAGHNPPLKFNLRTKKTEWLDAVGIPLGIFSSGKYPPRTIQLEKDDILILYTDGLTETENENGEQFSRERIAEIVDRKTLGSAQEIYDELQFSLLEFRGDDKYEDDLTLIVLKISE